ncbi:MAG TPA: putative toxin-antitoxin system toxin component, PIN family [Bryobacteraceae bacterium]|nr:putative toxin-antitoxin system toxin component, PIN family [Bryobacteraceae bacterium]
MLALKLVLDTNVVISGGLKPLGLERTALTFALAPPASLFVSAAILTEYSEVLSRSELRMPFGERQLLMELIGSRSRRVISRRRLAVCRDPDDDIFLECAEAAAGDYLITGNRKHFPTYWRNTKIISARELAGIIAPHLREL